MLAELLQLCVCVWMCTLLKLCEGHMCSVQPDFLPIFFYFCLNEIVFVVWNTAEADCPHHYAICSTPLMSTAAWFRWANRPGVWFSPKNGSVFRDSLQGKKSLQGREAEWRKSPLLQLQLLNVARNIVSCLVVALKSWGVLRMNKFSSFLFLFFF